nr:MAG TPA: hypothetical protein [Crassvirales sp.]
MIYPINLIHLMPITITFTLNYNNYGQTCI